jgi:uncharacterized protein (DUF2252 family)
MPSSTPAIDVVDCIRSFNSGRDPERLALKYKEMRKDAFAFLRATGHLFYQRIAPDPLLTAAPVTWICGDLHLENFGSYKGDNRLVYFDINDFDEAALAPCSLDLLRFLTSVFAGAERLSVKAKDRQVLCRVFLDAYRAALQEGKARWVERATAKGMVKDLLKSLKHRRRKDFLDSRTERKNKQRSLRIDGDKTFAAKPKEKERLKDFMKEFAATQPEPEFFKLLDAARRIGGLASLGLERFVLLVEGADSPHGNYLLDLKRSMPSSLPARFVSGATQWSSEAERVASVQRWVQAIPPAFLKAVTLDGKQFVLKELQPTADRLKLDDCDGALKRLEKVLRCMGAVTAWGHLRACGHKNPTDDEALVAYGQDPRWATPLIDLARETAAAVKKDWRGFCRAYDEGVLAG